MINHLPPQYFMTVCSQLAFFVFCHFVGQIYVIFSIEVLPFHGALAWDGRVGLNVCYLFFVVRVGIKRIINMVVNDHKREMNDCDKEMND